MVCRTLVDLYHEYFLHNLDQFFIRGEQGASTKELSVGDFADLVARYVSGLSESGVGRGQRVVLLLNTSIDYVALIWALVLKGCTAVPLPAPPRDANAEEFASHLAGILLVATPALIVVEGNVKLNSRSAPVRDILELQGEIGASVDCGVSEEDIAILQFTSGSTGRPKGCALSHRAVVSNVCAIRERLHFETGDVLVSWLPLFHDMGLMSAVFLPVAGKGGLNLRSSSRFIMNPLVWLEDLSRWPRCHTPVPNFALALTLQKLAIRGSKPFDLGGVRSIVCGAEPIDAHLVRQFFETLRSCNLKAEAFHAAYGMAEGTLMVSSKPGGLESTIFDGHEYVNLGRPIAGAMARVVDNEGNVIPEGSEGRIQIRSPSLMSSYFNDQKATIDKFIDGWLQTGDVGSMVEGNLFVFGRSDDLIIIGGRNLHPADLEAVIARAISIPPNKVAAYATKGDGIYPALNILVEYRANEAARKAARAVAVSACIRLCAIAPSNLEFANRGSIPRTTSGKIKRSALRMLHTASKSDNVRDNIE